MKDAIESIKTSLPSAVSNSASKFIKKSKSIKDKATLIATTGFGAIGANLSSFADIPFDYTQVTRIKSAMSNHGIAAADAIKALPDELTKYGTEVVDKFLKSGDVRGKEWSHIESQKNNPARSADASNALWEDGSVNNARRAENMSAHERVMISFDNHRDAFLTTVMEPEFWQRTLGNAFEASVYAAALTALDMFLIHRDELINGDNQIKKEILLETLTKSGIMAAGALPVSVVLAVFLLLVPGLSIVMAPLGLLGSVGLSLRLVSSLINHPSKQEKELLEAVQGHMKSLIYDLRRDDDGNITIDVKALPVT